ncbi:alpha-L-rhamnosidase C-terminal domain-containing protein [Actinomadura sp. HBU206391]|uniref:alpha-L-rhamnosidase C-terminal domain-containing protein n=1 Tax=Actinomadura sp. HBU206391 TaxID=2731692 RepID=UPI00164F8B25|nr:alpha-L-rhamnosidase C-terminal domain-containing protein [Actinomadura sp. HBU206391]MBC6456960.1 alpha-L-rhamnosidase [Actinomadura sp. HBU206391]
MCSIGALTACSGAEATKVAGHRDPARDATALSRRPIAPDPSWKKLVLNVPGPYVRPKSLSTQGDAGAVTDPNGLLEEGGGTTTLTTTADDSTKIIVDLGVLAGGFVELGVERASGAPIRMSYAEGSGYLGREGDADPDPGGFFYKGRTLSTEDDPDGRADVFDPPRRPMVLRSPGLRGAQRYIAITLDGPGKATLDFVRVRQTGFQGRYDGNFLSDDEVLNRAWYASAYGLDLSTIRGDRTDPHARWIIVDGPKRDRIVYAGDVRLVAQAAYNQSAEYRTAVRDTINLFACQQRPDGTFPAASRADVPCELGDPGPPDGSPAGYEPPGESGPVRLDSFTAWWVIGLADYLLHTGDARFVEPLLPVARRAVRFFVDRAPAGGLWRTADYDGKAPYNWHTPDKAEGVDAYSNAAYYGALRSLAALERSVAKDATAAARLDRIAARVRSAFVARLWDPKAGAVLLNTEDPRRDHSSDANAGALLFGLLDDGRARSAMSFLEQRLGSAYGTRTSEFPASDANPYMTQYISPYMVAQEGLGRLRYGDGTGALRLIRKSWDHMIRNGPGTAWEEIGVDGRPLVPRPGTSLEWGGHVGLAHAWSTAVPALSTGVLGVRPVTGAYRRWAVEPRLADLRWAQGDVPVPGGKISVRWRRGARDASFVLTVTSPGRTTGRVAVPLLGSERTIAMDGRIVWRNGGPAGVRARRLGGSVVFDGIRGDHTFAWTR